MLQFGASLLTTLAKARFINYNRNCSFIVLATVITIINYDRHFFIVQATDHTSLLYFKMSFFNYHRFVCSGAYAYLLNDLYN